MTSRTLNYFHTQQRLNKAENGDGMTCFYSFTLSEDEKHRLQFTKILASTPTEAYAKGETLGEWVDVAWDNEIFPTLKIKK